MNCDGVRELLSAFVDGELSVGEQLHVEQHLRRCHACADEVDALRQTVSLLASLDEVEVPETFSAQLHSRLVAMGPPLAAAPKAHVLAPKKRSVRTWALPATAAAAAFAIGLTALIQNPGALDTPPQVGDTSPSVNSPLIDGEQQTGADDPQGTNQVVREFPDDPPADTDGPITPPETGTEPGNIEQPGGAEPPVSDDTGGQNNNGGGSTPIGTTVPGLTANIDQPEPRTVQTGIYTTAAVTAYSNGPAGSGLRERLAQRYNQAVAPAAPSLTVRILKSQLPAEIDWLDAEGFRFEFATVDRSDWLMALEDAVEIAQVRLLQAQQAETMSTDSAERQLLAQELAAAREEVGRAMDELEAAQAELAQVTITIRLTGSN